MASKSKKKKVTNLTGRGLSKLDVSGDFLNSTTVILDDNKIADLHCLVALSSLEKLSMVQNHLDSLYQVESLSRLRVLNLKDNDITKIEGLTKLTHLEWLCLSGNKIETIKNLERNAMLRHLDLSSNSISEFGDLSFMVHLKLLVLDDNNITGLKEVPSFLPPSLSTLTLADNKLSDLTEVQLLSYLPVLEELSLSGNPFIVGDQGKFVDYRPYAICCCKNLMKLDGTTITQADKHNAKVLDAEDHLKMLQPGQHAQLAKYLLEASPGYSPKFSRKEKETPNSINDCNSTGVNSSLLESESVYLPVIYDSPPKHKYSSEDDSRPYTAPAWSDFNGVSWQDLLLQKFNQTSPNSKNTDGLFEMGRPDNILQPILSASSPKRYFAVDESFSETDKKGGERQGQERPMTAPQFETPDEKHKGVLAGKHQARLYIEELTDRSSSAGSLDVFSDAEDETQVQVALTDAQDETQVQCDDVAVFNENETPTIQDADGDLLHTDSTSVSLTNDEAMRVLHLAVAMIQACVRGFLQRKKYQRFLKRYKAATRIQALWRGYRTRFLDVKIVSLRNELRCRKLDARVNFLEAKLNRVQSERSKDKMIIGDIVKILMQEVTSTRDEMIQMRKESKAKSQYNDELHGICVGLQNEIAQLRGILEQGFQPGATYQAINFGQDRTEVSYKGKLQPGTKVSESSKVLSGALAEVHETSPRISQGPLLEAKSQEIATEFPRQHKNQETGTINALTELDNNYGQNSKDQDKRNNPSDDSICSEKREECSSDQEKLLTDSPSKQFIKPADAKHNEYSNSEGAELDKLARETESHIGKTERPSTVSLNETFDLSDSMDSADEDVSVFEGSECKTDSVVTLGALGSAELVAGENESTKKATGELLSQGDLAEHECGGKATGELSRQGDYDSMQETVNPDETSAAVNANSPVDTKVDENDGMKSGAKQLESPERREAFKELLGTLLSTSKTDKMELSTNLNPFLRGDIERKFERGSNSKASTDDAVALSLERDAEVHAQQVIVEPPNSGNIDTDSHLADNIPADDRSNSTTADDHSGDIEGLTLEERKNIEKDHESIQDAVALGKASTSESLKSALAMINLAGAKHLSAEKNFADTVKHQNRVEDAEDLDIVGKDVSQGIDPLFKIVNKAKTKRRSLFPSVTTNETPTISALPTAKYNTSFDSATSQGKFFSPITVRGLTVGDASPSLVEETDVAHETTEGDAETVLAVDGSKEEMPVNSKTKEIFIAEAQKVAVSVNKDIRSVYKEVSTHHGSLFGGTPVRQRADKKHSPGAPTLSKNFDADIKAIIDRSRLAVATKSNESGAGTASSLSNSLIAPKSEDIQSVSHASSSIAHSSRDLDSASKGTDASSKTVTTSSAPVLATKPNQARIWDEDKNRMESTAIVENAKKEDDVFVAADADKMAEDIAEITMSDTIVNVGDVVSLSTRTSTPVKKKPAPEAHREGKNQKSEESQVTKDSSPSKGLHDMPSCLQSMPQIVPVVQKAKEKSPGLPMFEDKSFDDDSFNV